MTTPLYQVVYNEIIGRIADGRYPPGSMLPNEFDLGAELGVSQGTARKALTELEHRRIIERRQGRGTFVTLRTPENSLFRFFRLRDNAGNQVVPKLETEEVIRRAALKSEKATLFGAPDHVFEIRRVRSFQGKPLCHETIVVPVGLFPGLPERAPLPNTLYVLFQQAYSCVIMSAEDNLRAGIAEPEIAAKLDIDPAAPVIIAQRRGHDLLDRLVEMRTSIYTTDRVSYSVAMD